MCNTIEQAEVFHDKEIWLEGTTLTSSDTQCLSLFLTSSFHKEWRWLNLIDCCIQDKGLNFLCYGLYHSSDITINTLQIQKNNLTVQSSSLISELTVNCKVKVLGIDGNRTVGENEQLYCMLTNPYSVLEILNMDDVNLSSKAASYLFTALKNNNTLKVLLIHDNDVTDDACDAITTALEKNRCLSILMMCKNPLGNEAIINIVQCLKVNDKLKQLGFLTVTWTLGKS